MRVDTQDTPSTAFPDSNAAAPTREEILYPNDQPQAEAGEPKPPAPPVADKPREDAPQDSKPTTDPDYKLQMPDGVELDQDLLTAAVPMLKEAGLSSDQASKLVPLVTQVQERYQQTQLDDFARVKLEWGNETRNDPEIGGKNLTESMRLAAVALNAGGTAGAEAREILNESGLGNHKVMVRLLRNLGAVIERGNKGSGPMKSVQQQSIEHHQKAIYPNDPPRRSWSEHPNGAHSPAARTRTERSYPNDQPKRG